MSIASHLPKAVGAAYAIGAARRHRPQHATTPDDAIVFCSFGDASANHSTAQGAFNAAQWTAYQSLPMPLLLCCEDRSEEHTSELQSLMRISYAVFCLKKIN